MTGAMDVRPVHSHLVDRTQGGKVLERRRNLDILVDWGNSAQQDKGNGRLPGGFVTLV